MTLMIVNLNLSVANREERVEDGIKFQPCRGLLYAVLKRPHGKNASRWTLSYSESSPRYYCESYEYQFIKWNRAVYIRNRFSAVNRCGKFLWNKKTILSITSYSAPKKSHFGNFFLKIDEILIFRRLFKQNLEMKLRKLIWQASERWDI